MIRASITALLLSAAPSLAEGVPYAPCDYPGQYAHCPGPTPTPGDALSVALQQAMAQGQAQSQNATGVGIGQGGNGGRGGNAKATGGRGGNAVSKNSNRNANRNQNRNSASTGPISIDNRTRQAASSAAAVTLPSNLTANCFGDVNPSGSFGASIQFFGGGAAATAQKAGNVCAMYVIGGPELALRYLQRMDPNVPRSVTIGQTATARCPSSHPNLRNGRCYQ